MSSPVSFALSVLNHSFKEKIEHLSTWILQFPKDQQERIVSIFEQILEPRITFVSTYGPSRVVEITRVEVMEDKLFQEMSWYEFNTISYYYKKERMFPTWKVWKTWHDRIYTERLICEKKDIHFDRFRLFKNHLEYLRAVEDIHKKLEKNQYGIVKLKEILQKEIQSIVYKVKCIENIRMDWAARKIQKAYRSLSCMHCGNIFYSGLGPFCSRECTSIAFTE